MGATQTARPDSVAAGPVLATITDLRKQFEVRNGVNKSAAWVHAVDGVDLEIIEGETLGLVGESGCGKSTLARVIVGLTRPSQGSVLVRGSDVHSAPQSKRSRGTLQMVFQDPAGSLNPRLRVRTSIEEPLRARGERHNLRERSDAILERVGLGPEFGHRYPGQLSGGQQQRVCIARALIGQPDLVVFDEAITSLDVSLQSQIISLIRDLRDQFGSTYLFITHDLARAMEVSDRIAIMYLGKVVEILPSPDFLRPLHPYSRALIAATPYVGEAQHDIAGPPLIGDVPSPMNPPSGCRFHTRCPYASGICQSDAPELRREGPHQWIACHFASEIRDGRHQETQTRSPSR